MDLSNALKKDWGQDENPEKAWAMIQMRGGEELVL